jgi:ubiquitin-protein ligase
MFEMATISSFIQKSWPAAPGKGSLRKHPEYTGLLRIEPASSQRLNPEAFTSKEGSLKAMHQSPRIRRLHSDLAALERLRAESSVFRFSSSGDPPQQYNVIFAGKSLWRDRGKVKVFEQHRVEIKLGASYPRGIPEIRWLTPIFHPNISEIGMVCLGGYGTHWVPSVQLDDLCVMLWDMARYHNYDIRSPYNRESALWVSGQTNFRFPIDARPLRDLRASQGRADSRGEAGAIEAAASRSGRNRSGGASSPSSTSSITTPVARVLQFIERYGRKPDDDSPRALERRNVTELMSRMSRGEPGDRRPADRSPDPGTNTDPPLPAQNGMASEKLESALVQEPSTQTTPEASPAQLDGDENDVMILEATPDDVRHETARTGNDEIMFIS